MKVLNYTPHGVKIKKINGDVVSFPSVGLARVSQTTHESSPIGEFKVVNSTFGQVEGLPDPKPDTIIIVSAMVLDHCKGRGDVYAPTTDGTAIRSPKGFIDYVVSLRQ